MLRNDVNCSSLSLCRDQMSVLPVSVLIIANMYGSKNINKQQNLFLNKKKFNENKWNEHETNKQKNKKETVFLIN